MIWRFSRPVHRVNGFFFFSVKCFKHFITLYRLTQNTRIVRNILRKKRVLYTRETTTIDRRNVLFYRALRSFRNRPRPRLRRRSGTKVPFEEGRTSFSSRLTKYTFIEIKYVYRKQIRPVKPQIYNGSFWIYRLRFGRKLFKSLDSETCILCACMRFFPNKIFSSVLQNPRSDRKPRCFPGRFKLRQQAPYTF